MDLKQIEKLMVAMEASQIKRVHLKKKDFEIELEKDTGSDLMHTPLPAPHVSPQAHTPVPSAPPRESTDVEGTYITSPMVGTFYSAPSPDDQPFIKAGDIVEEDTVVCVIEAMKVMNEVKAGVKGIIAEVLVKNGDPVEFGTNIFRIQS